MNKKLVIKVITFILLICFSSIFIYCTSQRITYREYKKTPVISSDLLRITSQSKTISGKLSIPYKHFSGISLNVKDYSKKDLGKYLVEIKDIQYKKIIYHKEFDVEDINENNSSITLINKNAVKVDCYKKYTITIKRIGKYYNDIEFDTDNSIFSINVFGGHTSVFWLIYSITISCFLLFYIMYILTLYLDNKKILTNPLFQAMSLIIVLFLMQYPYKNYYEFIDEIDYMASGLLVARGKILYIDYITQHMPFLTWFVALISLVFKTQSPEQIRLVYYIIISIVWALIYLRYRKVFGSVKMFFLPIILIVCSRFICVSSLRVMADRIEAICIVVIALEFMSYMKDNKLDLNRSLIISLTVVICFLSIFISIFPIFVIFIGFVFNEIFNVKKPKKGIIKFMFKRYYKLFIFFGIFMVILLLYLIYTKSLHNFYEQAYLFNRIIYPKHNISMDTKNFGSNIFEPFISGIVNFFRIVPVSIALTTKITDFIFETAVFKVSSVILFLSVIVSIIRKKQYILALTVFFAVCACFCRTIITFHSAAGYYFMITTILICCDFSKLKHMNIIFIPLIIILESAYIREYKMYLNFSNIQYSDADKYTIDTISKNDYIVLDLSSNPSLYLVSKNVKIANDIMYILPWYMEWYEDELCQNIKKKNPRIIISVYMNSETKPYKKVNNYVKKHYLLKEKGQIWEIR